MKDQPGESSGKGEVIDRLVKTRQQSIDEFFIKSMLPPSTAVLDTNPDVRNSQPSYANNGCRVSRIISHPLYHRFIPASQFHGDSTVHKWISEISCRKMAASLTLEKSNLSNGFLRPNCLQGINCMELDREEALLATGSSSGLLSIYDVDEVQYALHSRYAPTALASLT